MANDKFKDSLDALLDRFQEEDTNESNTSIKVPDMPEHIVLPPEEEPQGASVRKADPKPAPTTPDEINYGDNDLEDSIREAEAKEAADKEQRVQEAVEAHEAGKPDAMPPQPYDFTQTDEEMAHQEGTIEIVGKMVQEVARINNLTSGGIPVNDPRNPKVELRRHIMGDLIECYHRDGEVITQKFEDIVLSNWYMASGITAKTFVLNGGQEETTEAAEETTEDIGAEEVEVPKNPTININVEPGTPVTVNIDDSITSEIKKTQVVDVFVKEVTEKELLKGSIVTNTDLEGIIKPFDPGLQDIPVTLPTSGYRCIIRPFSWFEIISLVTPTARNFMDVMNRQWSIIYDHIKWTSIGDFKSYDEFISVTRFIDLQYFLWAILVATSNEEEDITYTCGNEKCKADHDGKYRPREIIRIDESKIPPYYHKAENAAAGPEAKKLLEEVVSAHKCYKLPDSETLVEMNAPTVKDFMEVRFGRMRQLYERFYPEGNFDRALPQILKNLEENKIEGGGEFSVLLGSSMLISAVYVKNGDKYYKYTEWEDIEKVITTHISFQDSYILFFEIFPKSNMFDSPVSFAIDGYICPVCGRNNETIPIPDIGGSLLFLLSRRYQNTTINLIEQPMNS